MTSRRIGINKSRIACGRDLGKPDAFPLLVCQVYRAGQVRSAGANLGVRRCDPEAAPLLRNSNQARKERSPDERRESVWAT